MNVPVARVMLQQAHRWRDVLWTAILKELEQRDPPAAHAVHTTLSQHPTLMFNGRSTWYAAWAWRDLDEQARQDWIWVCEFIQQIWARGALRGA
jgi:hypothetical protein